MARRERERMRQQQHDDRNVYYNSYEEEPAGNMFKHKQWEVERVYKRDYIYKEGVKHYRVKWARTHYNERQLRNKRIKQLLWFWANDILGEEEDGMGGKWVYWRDSYVAYKHFVNNRRNMEVFGVNYGNKNKNKKNIQFESESDSESESENDKGEME